MCLCGRSPHKHTQVTLELRNSYEYYQHGQQIIRWQNLQSKLGGEPLGAGPSRKTPFARTYGEIHGREHMILTDGFEQTCLTGMLEYGRMHFSQVHIDALPM